MFGVKYLLTCVVCWLTVYYNGKLAIEID